jgi:hypothetical protein
MKVIGLMSGTSADGTDAVMKGNCGGTGPGLELERVFGCRERGTQGVDEATRCHIRITRDHSALPLLEPGDLIAGARIREVMEVSRDGRGGGRVQKQRSSDLGQSVQREFHISFALNHTDQPAQPQFEIALPPGGYTATDVVTRQPVAWGYRSGRLVLGKPTQPEEIWVIRIVAPTAGRRTKQLRSR